MRLQLTDAQIQARRELDQAMREAHDSGHTIPCATRRWLFDGEGSQGQSRAAAELCGECPVFVECDNWRIVAKLRGGLIVAGQRV